MTSTLSDNLDHFKYGWSREDLLEYEEYEVDGYSISVSVEDGEKTIASRSGASYEIPGRLAVGKARYPDGELAEQIGFHSSRYSETFDLKFGFIPVPAFEKKEVPESQELFEKAKSEIENRVESHNKF